MSSKRADRLSSTASSNRSPSLPPNDETIDPSNMLYNDRQNYQIIFSNDSRFFDTSLHLFKSYCDLGYVKVEKKKSKKKSPSSASDSVHLRPSSNGFNGRWRPKTAGFSSNINTDRNSNGVTSTPSLLRRHDDSTSQRSDAESSRLTSMERDNSPFIGSDQEQTTKHQRSVTHSDSSDDPDIIVTRL